MNATLVSCTKCKAPLLGDIFNRPDLSPCPSCGTPLQVEIFPAMFRRMAQGREGEAVMQELEASCFYHPEKKAVLPCDSCGRFVCALCDCELHGQHVCPNCLESGRKKGKIKSLENRRVLYDDMALSLGIFSLIPYCFIVLAPAAIYIAIRHWKSPGSIIPRTKIRYVIAISIATLSLCFYLGIVILAFTGARSAALRNSQQDQYRNHGH